MNPVFDISIVISSYNQEDKIRLTLDSLFKSDLTGFNAIELIIIDDGSPKPVENIIPRLGEVPSVITLRLLKQPNSGIGATRNRGFREARSSFVLFLDDDIIVEKETVKKIAEAGQAHPGAVIFGNYPFVSHHSVSLEKFARQLYNYDEITTTANYQQVDAITSGLLYVNKEKLGINGNFYRDDLTVPAAEEHEIIARFHKQGIPIFKATHVLAIHNHHLELGWLTRQQFKYGLATAEAFAKTPEIAGMEKFSRLKKTLEEGGVRGMIKNFFSSRTGKSLLFFYARALEKLFPRGNHNTVFGRLTSASFLAGYRQGKRKFKTSNLSSPA